jgi:cysteine desulfurase
VANKQVVYLDYAAATPMDKAVSIAMEPYFTDQFYNPSATYLAAKKVTQDVEAARISVAKWLGARPSEIIFTAGGTEANNLAISGVMQAHPGTNIVTSGVEHDSVINPASQYDHKFTKVFPDGTVDTEDLLKKIDDKTVLVSIIYASNEIGTVQNLRQISKEIESVRQSRQKRGIKLPIYLHTDACQAAAYLDLHVDKLGVDIMTLNGGKIYGPKQSGVLYLKTTVKLNPQILGGGQERGLRSGTQNVPAIVGLAKALDLVQTRHQKEAHRLGTLQKLFFDLLSKEVPGARVNGSLKNRLPNNVHITVEGLDNERLMMELDERGIICAVGSACSASSEEPSHVLKAIGLSDKQAQSSLRFSMGILTTEAQVKRTVTELKQAINLLAKLS